VARAMTAGKISETRKRASWSRLLFYSHLLCSLLVAGAVALFLYVVVRDSLEDELQGRVSNELAEALAELQTSERTEALRAYQLGAQSIDRTTFETALAEVLRQKSTLRELTILKREYVIATSSVNPQAGSDMGLAHHSVDWQTLQGQPLAKLRASYDRSALDARLHQTRSYALLGFIGAVALSLLFAQLLLRQLRRSANALTLRFMQLAQGRFDVKLESVGDPDIDQISDAFNDMARRLNTSLGERERALVELKAARDRLEQSVKDRSVELDRINVLLRSEHEQRAQIEANLAEAAATDSLTRLLNRRAMLELIQHVGAYLQKMQKRCAFVMIDIDHFKQINDRFGHGQGDAVLRAVADCIRAELRTDEAAARWGGEEFLLLWPDHTRQVAEQRANRLRDALSMLKVAPDIVVTASMGVSEFDGTGAEAAINRADQCLYEAKAAGRNRVKVDSSGDAKPA
jgi:diguanylate cyclase (GGDEF)-like protein